MKRTLIMLLVLVMAFTVVGCQSNSQTDGEPTETPSETPSETPAETSKLEGAVIIDGSGTVYPLMAHIAEEYMTSVQPDVSVQVGRAGSSAGFKKFIPGETDFSDASRKIKDKEIAQLEEKGMKLGEDVLEFVLAYDGLTMVINKDNDWAEEMTREEIVNMYLASGGVSTWADIRPDWPAEEIKFYGPNENHGTYEFFYEKILDEQDMVESANLQQEYSTLVDLVSKDKNAIAFFGYGYYATNTDKLKAVKVDFGNGSVAPTLETIGMELDYAGFTRPVFTYLNVNYALEKPQVLDFAKYVVSFEGAKRLAGENGFAPLPDAMYEKYQKQLDVIEKTGKSVKVEEEKKITKLEGAVIIDGSGTVYPLMAHIAEDYMTNVQPDVSVQVGRAGSSAGFKKFIPGETDFSDASRKIKDKEITQLEEKGMKLGEDVLEFVLAYDGLTMVINKDNDWAEEMTREEIVNMYLASGGVTTWADIRPDWPAEEIKFYGPNENHGTYEFFYEKILDEQDMVESVNLQQEYSTLVDLVSKDKNAVAFFGYGYYATNTDKLKAIKVDFGNGSVAPSLETIGMELDYAGFTRPVFTYLNVNYALEKPQVLDFAKYVVSSEGAKRLAGENGFAPLPDAMYEEYQKQLDELK